MDEIIAESWEHAIEVLFEGDWNASLSRYRSSYAFRGTAAPWEKMPTSLARLGGNYPDLEPHLLRNFRKYAHREVLERDSFWHWLTLGQHFGLPTRLLDWTYSPLVALHFATDDLSRMNEDGVVWGVDIDQAHKKLPRSLAKVLEAEGASVFTVDLLSDFSTIPPEALVLKSAKAAAAIARSILGVDLQLEQSEIEELRIRTIGDLDKISTEVVCIFLEPPSIDERVVNQFALFSTLSSPRKSMDEWISENNIACKKLVIPAKVKWQVRDRLDQANISERSIYPGLEGIGRWLKRHYSPGPKA